MYCDAALSQRADGLESWLSPWVPLTLVTSPEASAVQVAAAAEVQVARTREAGPYARDLPLRAGPPGNRAWGKWARSGFASTMPRNWATSNCC